MLLLYVPVSKSDVLNMRETILLNCGSLLGIVKESLIINL